MSHLSVIDGLEFQSEAMKLMTAEADFAAPSAIRANWRGFFSLTILICLVFAVPVWGQKDAGTIVGLVKDNSGAVVADAKVMVTDVDRGTVFNTSTNSTGEYAATPLRIGRYTVTVEKAGFKKAVAGPVPLNVQDRLAVDVTLQLGTINETMVVTGTAPLLETESSDLGQLVDSRRATTLPLNGRNYAQLALLGAGVAPSEPGSRTETSYGFSSNGARSLQNNFLLDGVDNNANLGDVLNGSAYVIQPSVDAIAEFKVQTNSYSAEFGRGNGAILNAVIKSGTNDIHGSAYEFLRNEKLDARNAFDAFGRQPYNQNQFGFTLGGPIIKRKLFFFGDYEGLRIRRASPQLLAIPDPETLAGDFSSALDLSSPISGVLDCSGNPTYQGEIFNTRLTQNGDANVFAANNPTGLCGIPIAVNGAGVPTNIFPATGPNAINPVAAQLAQLFPQPNVDPNAFGGNNFLTSPKASTDQNNFDIRIDYSISQKDSLFGRFSYEDQPIFNPGPFSNFLDGGGFTSGNQDNAYRSVAISETHLFTPTLANEFRLGYNRINSQRREANAFTDVSGQLGLIGVPFSPGIGGLPSICFVNFACVGSSEFLPSVEKQNSYVLNENLTWIRGRHSWKFGTELRREQFTIFQPSTPRGSIQFGPDFTNNPGFPTNDDGSPSGGSDFASFLLGVPDGAQIVSLHNVDYRRNIYAFFVQDDFRLSDRLTLNLGLRYELFSTVKEAHDQQATFDFASQSLIVPEGQNQALTPCLAEGIPPCPLLPVVRTGSRGLIKPDLNNFAPRIGMAYRVSDKLVLRAGYGIFYGGQENGPFSNPSPGFNPPFFSSQAFNAQTPCVAPPFPPNANLSDPNNCAIGFVPPNGTNLAINDFWTQGFPAASLSDPNNPVLYSIDPHLRTPYTQQWHVGFQYELPSDMVVELSYAGSHGQNLYAFYNGNQIAPTDPGAGERPVPSINGQISTFRSNAYSNYNSLQARLEKRFSHGLQFEASYTYSHALDDASSASLGSLNNGDFRDQRYPFLEYGNADFDVRHRFVLSYVYDLPFGKGKAFGTNASGFVNQVIGNWQVAGIISASTGNYLTVTDPNNPTGIDCGGTVSFNCARPNVVGNPNGTPCVAGTFFNTCAFAALDPNGPVLSNEGRNIVRGPGYQNWDISLLKNFPIHEQVRFEFRAEFFNAWNHTNPLWGPIGAAGQVEPVAIELGTAQFGFVQAARDPRLIQFGFKLIF